MTLLDYMCIETHTIRESLNNQIRSQHQNYQTPFTSFETLEAALQHTTATKCGE
ncbi:hypothetical protein OIU77_001988, partial [Salix suchowensis]